MKLGAPRPLAAPTDAAQPHSAAGRWADALTALRVGRFDAVVVDLQLREGSGFGVLQHLKLNHPDLLAIVLTNSNTAAMRARSLALGAHHFLDKSSEFERVAELLEGLR